MGRRRNTSRKNSRKKTRVKSGGLDPKMREEIVLLFCCLFSFLLFLSNLGFCGFLGELLKKGQFLFFGSFYFLFPFLLFFLLLFYRMNRENPTVFRRISAMLLFYLLLESFFSTLFLGKEIPFDLFSLLEGGGIFGNGLLFLLSTYLGRIGALLVLFFFLLLSLVFVTEKPIVSLFTRFSMQTAEKAGRKAKSDLQRISTGAREALRERRERREKKEAKGVDFSATDFHIADFSEEKETKGLFEEENPIEEESPIEEENPIRR